MLTKEIIISALSLALTFTALWQSWRSRRYAPAPAWGALILTVTIQAVSWDTVLFWGIAAAIAVGINTLLPKPVASSTEGTPYMTGASLAGAFVGLLLGSAGLIVGAIAGAACGGIAYSRSPRGSNLDFPSRKFMNYLCAKGLPIVITCCISALTILAIITRFQTLFS